MANTPREHLIPNNGTRIYATTQGAGAPLVLINGLGTTTAIWDAVIEYLPHRIQVIRYDLRGHGRSVVPQPPYAMGQMISDAEAVLDHFDAREAMVVGHSLGGMIAQGLAIKRLDLVRALVLSNTAAKIGSVNMWTDRIDALRVGGMSAMADIVLERWFGRKWRDLPDLDRWRTMLTQTPLDGYIGGCTAIKGTDFYTPISGLRLPTLGIAGALDGATPPDLVRETVDLIPGADFHLLRRSGHLPCVQQPEAYAQLLIDFMRKTGHI